MEGTVAEAFTAGFGWDDPFGDAAGGQPSAAPAAPASAQTAQPRNRKKSIESAFDKAFSWDADAFDFKLDLSTQPAAGSAAAPNGAGTDMVAELASRGRYSDPQVQAIMSRRVREELKACGLAEASETLVEGWVTRWDGLMTALREKTGMSPEKNKVPSLLVMSETFEEICAEIKAAVPGAAPSPETSEKVLGPSPSVGGPRRVKKEETRKSSEPFVRPGLVTSGEVRRSIRKYIETVCEGRGVQGLELRASVDHWMQRWGELADELKVMDPDKNLEARNMVAFKKLRKELEDESQVSSQSFGEGRSSMASLEGRQAEGLIQWQAQEGKKGAGASAKKKSPGAKSSFDALFDTSEFDLSPGDSSRSTAKASVPSKAPARPPAPSADDDFEFGFDPANVDDWASPAKPKVDKRRSSRTVYNEDLTKYTGNGPAPSQSARAKPPSSGSAGGTVEATPSGPNEEGARKDSDGWASFEWKGVMTKLKSWARKNSQAETGEAAIEAGDGWDAFNFDDGWGDGARSTKREPTPLAEAEGSVAAPSVADTQDPGTEHTTAPPLTKRKSSIREAVTKLFSRRLSSDASGLSDIEERTPANLRHTSFGRKSGRVKTENTEGKGGWFKRDNSRKNASKPGPPPVDTADQSPLASQDGGGAEWPGGFVYPHMHNIGIFVAALNGEMTDNEDEVESIIRRLENGESPRSERSFMSRASIHSRASLSQSNRGSLGMSSPILTAAAPQPTPETRQSPILHSTGFRQPSPEARGDSASPAQGPVASALDSIPDEPLAEAQGSQGEPDPFAEVNANLSSEDAKGGGCVGVLFRTDKEKRKSRRRRTRAAPTSLAENSEGHAEITGRLPTLKKLLGRWLSKNDAHVIPGDESEGMSPPHPANTGSPAMKASDAMGADVAAEDAGMRALILEALRREVEVASAHGGDATPGTSTDGDSEEPGGYVGVWGNDDDENVAEDIREQELLSQYLTTVLEGLQQVLRKAEEQKRLEKEMSALEQQPLHSHQQRFRKHAENRVQPAVFSRPEVKAGVSTQVRPARQRLPHTRSGGSGVSHSVSTESITTKPISRSPAKVPCNGPGSYALGGPDPVVHHPDTVRRLQLQANAMNATYARMREAVEAEREERRRAEERAREMEEERERLARQLSAVMRDSAVIKHSLLRLQQEVARKLTMGGGDAKEPGAVPSVLHHVLDQEHN